ncbi:conserved hypothetical protein [Rhodococcus phage E3]|uniref:hypothetical protein n=1 Tax=Rhodococcus phage E3 TaxID=1007869 RepID=UPI0002C6BFA5|nr:hypothetical protein M176_gp027 [Rhodococcus phage E3]AEQ20937.1 conserved hypothetical protein [Rhodococcus phage E3]
MSKTVYNDPKHFGLEIVGELELEEPNYSFNMGVVWYRPETERFYFATDSGCSCPSPYEDYTSIESLEKPMTLAELTKELRGITVGNDVEPIAAQLSRLLVRAQDMADGMKVEEL